MITSTPLWITKKYNNVFSRKYFKWYDLGLLGVGEKCLPYINLDPYVQLPDNYQDIYSEIMKVLNSTEPTSGTGACMIPDRINNHKMPSYYSFNAEKFLTPAEISNVKNPLELDNLLYKKTDAVRIWEKTIMARVHPTNYWEGKNYNTCKWVRNDFPLLQKWVESLREKVFDQIGRVSIFNNKRNSSIWIHRDNPISGLKLSNHFINFRLSKRYNRPFFMFDEIENKKYYVQDCITYMFNEWDPHGADPEDYDDFTLRIDGKFKPYLSDAIGLKNELTWSAEYPSGEKLKNIKVYECN
jgi:hypothetical protein